MPDYHIDNDGTIIWDSNVEERKITKEDELKKEFSLLEYEVLNNHGRPTKDPAKLARYEELKKILKIDDNAKGKALLKAKQKILNRIEKKDDKAKILGAWKKRQNG